MFYAIPDIVDSFVKHQKTDQVLLVFISTFNNVSGMA
jgi:hypothetical protein